MHTSGSRFQRVNFNVSRVVTSSPKWTLALQEYKSYLVIRTCLLRPSNGCPLEMINAWNIFSGKLTSYIGPSKGPREKFD